MSYFFQQNRHKYNFSLYLFAIQWVLTLAVKQKVHYTPQAIDIKSKATLTLHYKQIKSKYGTYDVWFWTTG